MAPFLMQEGVFMIPHIRPWERISCFSLQAHNTQKVNFLPDPALGLHLTPLTLAGGQP